MWSTSAWSVAPVKVLLSRTLSSHPRPSRHRVRNRSSYDGRVQLPPHVRRSIEARAEAIGFTALKRASAALSDAYREGKPTRLRSDDHVAAYLVTRMPATYAAAR